MQKAKIEKMKAEGKDEADIKKMNEVLKKQNNVNDVFNLSLKKDILLSFLKLK